MKKDESKNIPKEPIIKDHKRPGSDRSYRDFFCPNCDNIAAYYPVGMRRISRQVQTRCRVCNQLIDWRGAKHGTLGGNDHD